MACSEQIYSVFLFGRVSRTCRVSWICHPAPVMSVRGRERQIPERNLQLASGATRDRPWRWERDRRVALSFLIYLRRPRCTDACSAHLDTLTGWTLDKRGAWRPEGGRDDVQRCPQLGQNRRCKNNKTLPYLDSSGRSPVTKHTIVLSNKHFVPTVFCVLFFHLVLVLVLMLVLGL